VIGGSVPDLLRHRAASTPARLALICGEMTLTFAELDARVDVAVEGLIDAGVAMDERLGLLAANGDGFAIVVHAAARLGAVLVPLNLRLAPAELAWQVADAGLVRIVADVERAAAVEALGMTCVALEEITGQSVLREPQDGRMKAQGGAQDERSSVRRFALSAVQTVVYTSGTSGRPKGAQLTHGNHLWSALASALNLGLREDDRWLACLPLYHVGGHAVLIRSVVYGVPVVIHEAFDAERISAAIDEGVTHVSLVANTLQRLLEARKAAFPPTLRCVLLGGGPAPLPLLEDAAGRGVPVVQTYGMTETASQIVTLAPEDALRKLGSAGKPLMGAELRIVDETGVEQPAGEPGEIVVRGPSVTPGYLNGPSEALRHGWLHTGDIGHVDAEGYLYVLDRRDDLIVSGGENVYPAEVEAALQAHADVIEAGVTGADDPRWGRVPVAAIVLRPGATSTADDLIAHCRDRLADYKTPKRIVIVEALPRTAAGKLLRRELHAYFV
jgi:O-succinylbenzoic acid--CoA ligase